MSTEEVTKHPGVQALAHFGRNAIDLTIKLQAEVRLLDEINLQLCEQNTAVDKRCDELERMCHRLASKAQALLLAPLDPAVRDHTRSALDDWEAMQ